MACGLACGLAAILIVPLSLGTVFAGLALTTTMLPGLVLVQSGRLERASALGCFMLPLVMTWLRFVGHDMMSHGEWLRASVVPVVYAWAICGLACGLGRLRLPPAGAAAFAILMGVLWLGWPIWLAPWLRGASGETAAARLIAAHPAFVLNGVFARAFPTPWAQHRVAYELTNIGDDIPYEMPAGMLVCLLLHGSIGLGCLTRAESSTIADNKEPA